MILLWNFRQFIKFTAVSGIGWFIDISLFYSLIWYFNLNTLYANLIGAFVAVTLVFFVSIHKVFIKGKSILLNKFLVYLFYQVVSISLFSKIIDWLSHVILFITIDSVSAAMASKIILTPITLIINYIFMKILSQTHLERKR